MREDNIKEEEDEEISNKRDENLINTDIKIEENKKNNILLEDKITDKENNEDKKNIEQMEIEENRPENFPKKKEISHLLQTIHI